MLRRAIYMTPNGQPQASILSGLQDAECQVVLVDKLGEVLRHFRAFDPPHLMANGHAAMPDRVDDAALLFVVKMQAGAIAALTLMREQGIETPCTLVYDEDGSDVRAIIRALQLGVCEYILASDPEPQQRLSTRLFVERACARQRQTRCPAPMAPRQVATVHAMQLDWDAALRTIRAEHDHLRLSQVESLIFEQLHKHRGQMVDADVLVRYIVTWEHEDVANATRRLRSHVLRMKHKLDRHPALGVRIVNIRGMGYMML